MSKIRVIPDHPPGEWVDFVGIVAIYHCFNIKPYEKGAYHTAWCYPLDQIPGFVHAYQFSFDLAHGDLLARSWSAMPRIAHDICMICNDFKFWGKLSRWNIYRGLNRVPISSWVGLDSKTLLPCFYQPWDAPPPPGYG